MSLSRRSACDVGSGTFVNLPIGVKNWAPGHYIAVTEDIGNDDVAFNQILDRLAKDTAGHFKGVMLRFQWYGLETAFNVYSGFDTIKRRLDAIAGLGGRRVIVFIQLKTFHTKNASGVITSLNPGVPSYMDNNPIYADPDGYTNSRGGYGSYTYKSNIGDAGGEVASMHVDAVRDRFKAMMTAFGIMFNSHPYLEGVIFSEASVNKPQQVIDTNWNRLFTSTASTLSPASNGWYDNMTDILLHMRNTLTNISICQWINARRKDMKIWLPEQVFPISNIGIGMPDLCKHNQSLNYNPILTPYAAPGNIYYMQQRNNLSILIGHASREAQNGSVLIKAQTAANAFPGQYAYPGLAWGPQDIADFAYLVGCTHVLWRHTVGTHNVNQTYLGQQYNDVVDDWISNPASDRKVHTDRPIGW